MSGCKDKPRARNDAGDEAEDDAESGAENEAENEDGEEVSMKSAMLSKASIMASIREVKGRREKKSAQDIICLYFRYTSDIFGSDVCLDIIFMMRTQ